MGRTRKGGRTQLAGDYVAWAAMPLFLGPPGPPGPYVRSGAFRLPLYQGRLPPGVATRAEAEGVEAALLAEEQAGRARPYPGASLLVRVVDVQVPPPRRLALPCRARPIPHPSPGHWHGWPGPASPRSPGPCRAA